MIEPEPLQQIERTYVRVRNRKLSYFSGCDYFRLASHPQVIQAVVAGVKKFGLNVAASRLTTGNHILYGQLEKRLAGFFDAQNALLLPNGYNGNLIVAGALARSFSHALLDEKSHPSLADAARFLDCPVLRFKHQDPQDAARAVQRCGPKCRIILLTDGMFANDGSAAPLAAYLSALPKDALMLVDDAHGAGVLGKSGQGTLQHAGVSRTRIIQTVTLSKAFGAYGGAILGTRALRRRILRQSSMFIGSTPLPLPLANAALESIGILKRDTSLHQRLFQNSNDIKTALRDAFQAVPGRLSAGKKSATEDSVLHIPGSAKIVLSSPGPIVPVIPHSPAQASKIKRALLAAGIFPPFIKYPGGPGRGYFRFVISSEHSRSQLTRLAEALISAL